MTEVDETIAGGEINPRKGEDNYETQFANMKRTYDEMQDLSLERKSRSQDHYDALLKQSQRAVDESIDLSKRLNAILLKHIDEAWGDNLRNRRNTSFNEMMNQSMDNRLYGETEIPEAAALSEILKTSKLGAVDLLQWLKTLISELEPKTE